MSEYIKITANNQKYELTASTTLSEFLEQHEYQVGQVVCERNGNALSPSEMEHMQLQDGDVIEIVRIVAGG